MDINLLKIIGTSENEAAELVKAVMAGTIMVRLPQEKTKEAVKEAQNKFETGTPLIDSINQTLLKLSREHPKYSVDLAVLANEVKEKLGKKEG